MSSGRTISLILDPEVRRAAVRAAPSVSRLAFAVGKHLARDRAAELGLIETGRGRKLAARTAVLGAGLAIGAGLLGDEGRRREIAKRLGR